ncbi:hypothetical protein BDN70DRAFT_859226 [Pholiota conissans]|uniref:Uncharacterized protein n=1 Tax=Pholiota conissans TaxID=109636 RepID=A0A9P5Z2G3_9AGAR|nr:hypothetical protein BDN70DRAFT_859226 [Pholiota conissans]
MSTATIKITYNLKPPSTIEKGNLSTSKSHEFPVKANQNDNSTAFYTELRISLEEARNQIGDELTAWRDVVGKAELSKEPKIVAEEDEEDEEA